MNQDLEAKGHPGIPARWTSSAKTGVGTARSDASHVWFTLSHGILNEIYFPRLDRACTRDCGLIVTDGRDFFSEEKRQTHTQVSPLEDGVPGYRLINTCLEGRYRIEKTVICDPERDALLQHIRFVPLRGTLDDYRVYVLLAPHLDNEGAANSAYVQDYKGVPMLFATREATALALACSRPWRARSVGFVGASDGFRELAANKQLLAQYARARDGNVALTGELDLRGSDGEAVLSIAFGRSMSEAGQVARASLQQDFTETERAFTAGWRTWQQSLLQLHAHGASPDLFRTSSAVLGTHGAKQFAGGMIASLSIPWGFAKGDNDLGGYHLVWPRDLVESAGALLAAGAHADAREVLAYLQATQEADGHWPQNMWLDGSPFWTGIQLDETAFPILLLDLALREGALAQSERTRYWPMVRRAAGFLARTGPVTQQDRWEEDPGYSPFTLAVSIAGLLVAAELADSEGEPAVAARLRETADAWNECVEQWTYVTGTELAMRVGVAGYYIRVAAPDTADGPSPATGFVPIKNRSPDFPAAIAQQIVSPDALALVRFGLRDALDPRIVDTVKTIDALLALETPRGPVFYRYNEDGYGEHADGSAFDGTGIGRPWPLLTGERAHYELAAGRPEQAQRLLDTLGAFANEGGLLPEQVWDQPDIPDRELFFAQGSGSAMPLVWAHAEYIKLCRSLRDRRLFDRPPQTVARYAHGPVVSPFAFWRFNHQRATFPAGKRLRIEVLAPAVVHYSFDGWRTSQDLSSTDTTLGLHIVDLATESLPADARVCFTFLWTDEGRWEGADFTLAVAASSAS